MADDLTHIDAQGNARMVDVSGKQASTRLAVAEAWVRLSPETLANIVERRNKKGDVFAVAQLAGIQGSKRTSDLIPLCHPIPIDSATVDLTVVDGSIRIVASVQTHWRTGVEMEAMTAAMTAALTIYDMCKAIDRGITVEAVRLLEKRGGRSGTWIAE